MMDGNSIVTTWPSIPPPTKPETMLPIIPRSKVGDAFPAPTPPSAPVTRLIRICSIVDPSHNFDKRDVISHVSRRPRGLMPIVNTTQLLAHLCVQTVPVRRIGIADLAENFATQRIGADVRLIDDGIDDRQVGAAGRAIAGVFIPSAAQIGGFTDQLMYPARQSAASQIAKRDNACTDLDQIIVGLVRVGHGHLPMTSNAAFSPAATSRD